MLTWLSGNAAGEITTPAAGWTLVESDFGGDVGEGTGVHLYARTATSELSPYTWGWSGEHWHYGLCITVQDTGGIRGSGLAADERSEEHTSELQSRENIVCRLLLEKKNS